ncbi:hypothetical protein MC885_007041 [Smutsia gigantea]|nr:hypothetical protein MC885_007041 [Smutsia gigantea]
MEAPAAFLDPLAQRLILIFHRLSGSLSLTTLSMSSMEALIWCARGPDTGGHPPGRGHGLLVPPHRPALCHQRPPRYPPAGLPHLAAPGQLAGAAGTGLCGWWASAAAWRCHLQWGRPLSAAHGCWWHRAP